MQYVLNVDSLVKRFGKINAVDNVSFSVNEGEVFALLGPNGAGKTTTVRMLMNIIKPDEGNICFNLKGNSSSQPPASELGYLPEERGLYQDIKIIKTLEFMGIIRGMNKTEAKESAGRWLEKLNLSDRKNEKLSALSKGNQQKIQFISSILHNPKFAILDEPFSGFDPINQETFLDIINELRNNGMTILLSAHQMQLVEKIADRVLLLNQGKIIAHGPVDEIKQRSSSAETIYLDVEGMPDLSPLQKEKAVEKAELLNGDVIKISLKKGESLSGLLKTASSIYKINSVKTEHVSLHDIFIELVKKDSESGNEK